MSPRRIKVAVFTGSGLFSMAFIAPSALLPWSDTTPMLVTVGVAVPTAAGFAVLNFINYVATKEDVRVARQVQPEPVPSGEAAR
jgi:hypothetical protein